MTEAQGNENRSMNRIGAVLAVLMTAAIVGVVFWQARPGSDSSGDYGGPPSTRPMGSEIEEIAPNTFRAYAGQAFVFVRGNPATDFEFRMRIFGMIDDDTRLLIRAERTLILDPNAPKAIDLTDEQLEKVKSLDPPRMVLSDDDRSRFIEAWHAWEKVDEAHKDNARAKMLDVLREISEKSVEPTKKAWLDSAAAFKQTLTIQQMAKLAVYQEKNGTPGLGFGGPPFASQPTTTPQ